MIIYILIGLVWTAWLEYYTTRNLDGELGSEWSNKERIAQCALWPINVTIFIVAFFRGM